MSDPITQRPPEPPNIEDFPQTPNDFLAGIRFTDDQVQTFLDSMDRREDDPENLYPSFAMRTTSPFHTQALLGLIDEILKRGELTGRILLYGAGTLTAQYIDYLREIPGIVVVGVIDRDAEPGATFKGAPLIQPSEHSQVAYDKVFILHFCWEPDMVKTAMGAGIPGHKILTGLSDKVLQQGYLKDCSLREIEQILKETPVRKNLVVATLAPKWSVLALEDCNLLYPPDNTNHIIYAHPGIHLDSWNEILPSFIRCPRSRPYLKRLLAALRPERIYLKVSPHIVSEWLPAFVRSILPNAEITVEYYDMGVLFSNHLLKENIGYSDYQIQLMKAATHQAATGGIDRMIVKSGGSRWNSLEEHLPITVHKIFPLLSGNTVHSDIKLKQDHLSNSPRNNRKRRIIYAGSVPARELTHGLGSHPGANMLRYFYHLTEREDISIDLFNASDQRDGGPVYSDNQLLETTFSTGPIRYYPSIPFDTLMAIAGYYDFGFTAVHYPNDFTENVTRSGIGNRFVGYIMAGLPVIVDSYFEFQAELIRCFNAGIVIAPEQMEEIPNLVRLADLRSMRAGVERLHEYMVRENIKAFQSML